MRSILLRSVLIPITLSCGLLYGQTQSISIVTSSYAVTLPAGFTGTVFSTLQLGVSYPAGLSASSYIPIKQLNADFQGFISAYPNPSDAPEAYLSIALQQILSKYPQITGGTLVGQISGPGTTIPGTTVTIPGSPTGSVTVAIGTYSAIPGLASVLVGTLNGNVSYVSSSRIVTLPAGFTGTAFTTLNLGVTYPTGLPASSYITINQLNSDFQSAVAAYPNPADPPEAYLSVSLQQIMTKYSQIAFGTLSGSINGPGTTIPGTTVSTPGALIGTVSVAIGSPTGVLSSLYSQSGPISIVNSTWAVTLPAAFNATAFSILDLSVTYPTGLTASSYITSQQLNTDFQGFVTANSSPTDAPEAYLSMALQQILNKYTQMAGGSTIAEVTGPGTPIPGTTVTIPGSIVGTVEVVIGTYSPLSGLIPLTRTNATGSTSGSRSIFAR